MIDTIKNPPKGFEKVVRRSFYLKKNVILEEVKEWVERAKTTEALYTGLVFDHNYHWAPQISQPGKYVEMITAIYEELKQTLEEIESPFQDEITGEVIERRGGEVVKGEKKAVKFEVQKFDDIDVSYDPAKYEETKINIDDDKVKDRWSRYIGAMGIEAVAK